MRAFFQCTIVGHQDAYNMARILLIPLLIIFSCSSADEKANVHEANEKRSKKVSESKGSITVLKPIRVKAMTSEIMEDDTVEIEIEGNHYTLFPYGRIIVQSLATNQKDTFQLNTELLIEEAHFFNYKTDLVIYYTDSDFESGSSYIECYDHNTYKLKWKNNIYGFNLTDPIILDNSTYVASFGFIGKLNLDNGKYFWKHENLYEETKFNSFGSIEINDDKVYFSEGLWVRDTRTPGQIVVNDVTGEIVNIIKTKP